MNLLLQDYETERCFANIPDSSVVPRVGEMIYWKEETYKVMGVTHDVGEDVIILDVELSGYSKRERMDAQSPPP